MAFEDDVPAEGQGDVSQAIGWVTSYLDEKQACFVIGVRICTNCGCDINTLIDQAKAALTETFNTVERVGVMKDGAFVAWLSLPKSEANGGAAELVRRMHEALCQTSACGTLIGSVPKVVH